MPTADRNRTRRLQLWEHEPVCVKERQNDCGVPICRNGIWLGDPQEQNKSLICLYTILPSYHKTKPFVRDHREHKWKRSTHNCLTREVEMSNDVIDVHCHFFNAAFAFEELLEIGWRWLHGDYPYKSDELRMRPKGKAVLPAQVQGIVEYVASFFAAAVRSPDDNYRYEQDCFKASGWNGAKPVKTVPLMMDIFFILDNGSSQQHKTRLEALPAMQRKAVLHTLAVAEKDLPSFDAFAEEMKAEVMKAVSRKSAGKSVTGLVAPASTVHVAHDLDEIIREFKAAMAPTAGVKAMPSGGSVQMTRGYRKHLEALRSLRKKNPDTAFPFLAVDPRRIGIDKLVRDQVVKGSFRGVKLYCPLGYLPSHPALNPVFKLCVEQHIPVTTHTSPGGLPSMCAHISTASRKKDGTIVPVVFDSKNVAPRKGESAQSLFFADPDNWYEVLESDGFDELRVNFAHFGGQDNILAYANGPVSSNNWTGRIIRLMERFNNVYADISFCPDSSTLVAVQKIIGKHPVVKDRLMFGTDFVMIMTNQCGLKNYFIQYKNISLNNATKNMATINPGNFLKF